MKRTVQIHIGGQHFHIDEDAYLTLNNYLESLKNHFAKQGTTGQEIVDDIEQRIADLLESKISGNKQAITLEDVNEVIQTLGKIEDFVFEEQADEKPYESDYDRKNYRRLFRDSEHNYLGGVAAGIGAYFDIDPLWIRLVFFAAAFLNGFGVLVYIILWIVVPKARTTTEKLQMQGIPVNLSTIKESVNSEFHKVKSSFHTISKSSAADKTRDVFENILHAFVMFFAVIFKFIISVIGIVFIFIGSIILISLVVLFFGPTSFMGHIQIWPGMYYPDLSHLFASSSHYYLILISLLVLIVIPLVALIYGGIKIIFNIHTKNRVLRAFTFTAWLLALILFVALLIIDSPNFAVEAKEYAKAEIQTDIYPKIYIRVRDNAANENMTIYSIFDYEINYDRNNNLIYRNPELDIEKTADKNMSMSIKKYARNLGMKQSYESPEKLKYDWEQKDSILYLDKYFDTDHENLWMFGEMKIKLLVPENQIIVLSNEACDLLNDYERNRYCSDSLLTNKNAIMTTDGLMLLEKYKKPILKN